MRYLEKPILLPSHHNIPILFADTSVKCKSIDPVGLVNSLN